MKKRVLFLGTRNSCRSQMAEAIMRSLAANRFEAFSAGSRPSGYVHPMTLDVLRDAHLLTEGLRSKPWEEFRGQRMNFVITVSDRAKESCPIWPGQPTTAHWEFENPAEAQGAREGRLRVFRKVFSEIHTRIRLFTVLPFEKLAPLELETEMRDIGQPLLVP